MPRLQLVIFDCDGVMFDSREANRYYYNHLLQKFGHPLMTEEEVNYVHIHHVMDSLNYIFRHYPADIKKADTYRATLDYSPFLRHMVMEPDLKDFLEFLKPEYKTAISTNRTTTMPAVLELFDLRRYFEKVVTALDVKNPKPHPEALHQILGFFGLAVDEAVYIGDSSVDRDHTAYIGMRLIAFKNPNLAAEFHVSSFMEIIRLINDIK